jgi:hypothetical protein
MVGGKKPEEAREVSVISGKIQLWKLYLYCLYRVIRLATLMLLWTTDSSCWLILVRPRVLLLAILATALVTQSGVRKLIYIMMVAIR